jgi:hypothetical protein
LWVTGLLTGDAERVGDPVGLDGTPLAVGDPVGVDVDGDTLGLGDLVGFADGLVECDGGAVVGVTVGFTRGGVVAGLVDGVCCGRPVVAEALDFDGDAVGLDAEELPAGVELAGVGVWFSLPITCCSVITWGWLPLISWPTRPTAVNVTPVTSAHDSTHPTISVRGFPASDRPRDDTPWRPRRWFGSDTPSSVQPVTSLRS